MIEEVKAGKLYLYLGMADKNNNNKIEKKVVGEGYKEEYDIDKNEELVKAEILYALHFIKQNVDDKILQENPLTDEDKKVLLEIFNKKLQFDLKINDEYNRAQALADLAKEIAPVDFGNEDLKNLFGSIVKEIKGITPKKYYPKANFLGDIASIIPDAEMKKSDIRELFNSILKASYDIEDKRSGENLRGIVAVAMAKAGFLDDALEIVDGIKENVDPNIKKDALMGISIALSQGGLNKEQLTKVLMKLINITKGLENNAFRDLVYGVITRAAARVKMIKISENTVEKINNPYYKNQGYCGMCFGLAEAGEYDLAIEKTRIINDSFIKCMTYAFIVVSIKKADIKEEDKEKLTNKVINELNTYLDVQWRDKALELIENEKSAKTNK